MLMLDSQIKHLVRLALSEDIGKKDLTSDAVVRRGLIGKAVIEAKEQGVLAGLPVAQMVFKTVDAQLAFIMLRRDGQRTRKGEKVVLIEGEVRSILTAERTALNFLQRLSGIATLTSQYVERLKGTKAKVLDTRKTTPGLRILEKYAVKTGGGHNHRMGLFDMVLIKENHIKAAGSVSQAMKLAKTECKGQKLEVEVRSLTELKEALKSEPDWIMLDNMDIQKMKRAVSMIRSFSPGIKIEASGGVELKNVRRIASTGVDFISVGALTHSAPALDLSLKVIEP
jgi:nicotinate-nucleotide pyrophosphorylase (carboxylating)